MVRVACFYSGDFEPGNKSLQQQRAESRVFVKQMGWHMEKEISEKETAKARKMGLRGAIQMIIEDAKQDEFDIFLVWGIRCLSDDLQESAQLLFLLEKAGVTVMLVDMARMAKLMGGDLLKLHNSDPQDVPKNYYAQFKKNAGTHRKSDLVPDDTYDDPVGDEKKEDDI